MMLTSGNGNAAVKLQYEQLPVVSGTYVNPEQTVSFGQ
jgi:hypothetical protein